MKKEMYLIILSLYGLARSGDMIVEIMEDELIPLPEGATLVGLPSTRPIGMDPDTGEMMPLPSDTQAVRCFASARIYSAVSAGLCENG